MKQENAKNPPAALPAIRKTKMGPIEHQFKPGQSGNPSGRPKTRHISEALRENLDSCIPDGSKNYAQAIADRLCSTAAFSKRDSQATDAAEVIASRLEGKPIQAVRVENPMTEETLQRITDLAAVLLDSDGPAPVLQANSSERLRLGLPLGE